MPINIPQPCNANWSQMKVGISSRYCNSCSKHVIDFRNQSKEEILKRLIENRNTSVCGRFKQSQIDLSIIDEAIAIYSSKRTVKSRISYPFALLSLAIVLNGCQEGSSINAQSNTEINQIDSSKSDTATPKIQEPEIMGDVIAPDPIDEIMGEVILMPVDSTDVYTIVEHMPQFKGGDEAMFQFISKNLEYPSWEEKEHIEGIVYVRFIIDTEGNCIEPQILKTVNGSKNFNTAVLELITKMPKWKPGMQRGRAVQVQYNLPIRFTLN